MDKIPSYPKIFNLGNDAIDKLFDSEVEITEKIDGSQFRFAINNHDELMFGSKGVQLYSKEQNGMFALAIEQIEKRHDKLKELRQKAIKSTGNPDITLCFYGEYLSKPKHNCLAYERTPDDNIILFSVKVGENFVKDYDTIKNFAKELNLEVVPMLFKGIFEGQEGITRYDKLKGVLELTSLLGGQKIEGFVIKNYNQFHFLTGGPMPCFGKYVREDFKEKLHKEWPSISGKNSLQEFIDGFKSEARWKKAVQHLKERGELTNSPRDIGNLMKEVHVDIIEEEAETIKKFLYNYFVKDIKRRATQGLPEWFKDQLLKKQCEDK